MLKLALPSILLLFAMPTFAKGPATSGVSIEVIPHAELARLLRGSDADGDKRITVDDLHHPRSSQAKTTFWLDDVRRRKWEVSGTYYLSNLLQELKLATDQNRKSIAGERIFENPVHRISRSIREMYWDNLTRRVDGDNLAQVLPDTKLPPAEFRHLYVPFGDEAAFAYFEAIRAARPELKFKVWKLPKNLGPDELQEIRDRHGVLTLALEKGADGKIHGVPFVVPGGRFNEMYGWDSYFEALGLLNDGRLDLAKAMVDNFVYQIQHYGKILNANRSYYLNRSQPPFLTSMIVAVYEKMEKTTASKAWLERSLRAAVDEYFKVWMNPERLTETGLSRYYGNGKGIPPEVEPGHFDFLLKPAAKRHRLTQKELVSRYNSGQLKDPELDEFFAHDRAVRESGHDTTYRWRVAGRDRAADFVTVDLNALLYKYELDIARLIRTEFRDSFDVGDGKRMKAAEWLDRATKRKALMLQYLWDPAKKLFFDYNFKDRVRSDYVSATTFYPLWSVDPTNDSTRILNANEANELIRAALSQMETAGGVAATSEVSLAKTGDPKHARQWDFPNGWAPHQMLIWQGLLNYRQKDTADRLIYKWLYTITKNAADFNGTVPEKYDVVRRSHAVFAEYGNVGTDFSYITQEGFGWMNASYQVGLSLLSAKWEAELEMLKPPEWVAFVADEGKK